MKKLLLTTALVLAAAPAFAKEYVVKEVTDYDAKKQHFFSPDTLTIQPGDTVIFENAQDETHEVMFINVPKQVNELIMSPLHEKKGESFTYTFTVPGTYKFHCHPHEKLGMDGTLIVGQASKPGETKAMDHHKLAKKLEDGSTPAAGGLHQGIGKINSIDTAKRTVSITHQPIKSLNWPKMKMLLNVDQSINLSGFQAGDAVSFTLKPEGKDDYIVVNMKKHQ